MILYNILVTYEETLTEREGSTEQYCSAINAIASCFSDESLDDALRALQFAVARAERAHLTVERPPTESKSGIPPYQVEQETRGRIQGHINSCLSHSTDEPRETARNILSVLTKFRTASRRSSADPVRGCCSG